MIPKMEGDIGGVRAGLVLDPVRQGVNRCASTWRAGVFLVSSKAATTIYVDPGSTPVVVLFNV